jgi:hypothetical protein
MFSTLSYECRMPAVSAKHTDKPASVASAVTTSLVVPGVDETIDASALHSALNIEDLPAFGGPVITTELPRRAASMIREDASCVALQKSKEK